MVERAKELMESKDPMCYGDVTYKDFCNDKDRVELLEALCVGDEDFVRKALALKPGQDGLYLNLNCCPQHPEMPALAYEYGVNNEMPYKPAREDQRRLAIGDEGVAILAKCLPKTGLRSLIVQLSRNKITHKGFKAFAAAIPSDVEDLKLYFHANSIGDRGACSIAWKIKNMKKLKSLYMCLGCNEIHDQGNQMIAECLPATLEHYSLMMRWNPTMDEQTVGRSVMYDASHRLPKIPTGLDASRFYLLY